MKDAKLYKEAAEHGYALIFRENGAILLNHDTTEVTQIVEVGDKGIKAVIPAAWEADFARRVTRMMNAEVKRELKKSEQD